MILEYDLDIEEIILGRTMARQLLPKASNSSLFIIKDNTNTLSLQMWSYTE